MSIEAKVICDSISPQKVRLTTLELKFHRFILPEFNTHRMFSRNASSSRAIPIERVLEQVKNSPAMPIHWGKNQPGMQAREEIESPLNGYTLWTNTGYLVSKFAEQMNEIGLHKQVVNRILEPFQWIKVIVTATEWGNFFKLRDHLDAQPEIRELAKCMRDVMNSSTPQELNPGEWHLPFLTGDERSIANPDECLENAIKWSVARCARVSYLNHDNSSPDIEKDIILADKLLEAGHMSPMEHQLTPIECPKDNYNFEKGVTHIDRNGWKWSGNSRAWLQYRQLI